LKNSETGEWWCCSNGANCRLGQRIYRRERERAQQSIGRKRETKKKRVNIRKKEREREREMVGE
jgi:hypothetical protein